MATERERLPEGAPERRPAETSEWQQVTHNAPRGYDVQSSPLTPPKAPPVSFPTARGHHRPDDGSNEAVESLRVFGVIGLLGLALALFLGLMLLLNLTLF